MLLPPNRSGSVELAIDPPTTWFAASLPLT